MNASRPGRFVTILIHRDGDVDSRSYRLPLWLVRTTLISTGALVTLFLIGLILYGPIVRAAARVPFLTREIGRLTQENQQVRQLASRLGEMEARYAQVRGMLGGDLLPPGPAAGESLPVAYGVMAAAPGRPALPRGPSPPVRWPLDERGVVTRGQITDEGAEEPHPGIDIAVPTGTPIRAAGGGRVTQTGSDAEYGLYVLITHPDGYQSMYGHASRILAADGDEVNTGQVVALSGSTGRSTAPHLHFEIRRSGRSIDPRSLSLEDF